MCLWVLVCVLCYFLPLLVCVWKCVCYSTCWGGSLVLQFLKRALWSFFSFCFKTQNNFQKQTKIKSLWDFLKLRHCSLCFLLFCMCAWALVSRVWHRENERERFIHLVGWFLDVPMVIKQDVVNDLLTRQAWVFNWHVYLWVSACRSLPPLSNILNYSAWAAHCEMKNNK